MVWARDWEYMQPGSWFRLHPPPQWERTSHPHPGNMVYWCSSRAIWLGEWPPTRGCKVTTHDLSLEYQQKTQLYEGADRMQLYAPRRLGDAYNSDSCLHRVSTKQMWVRTANWIKIYCVHLEIRCIPSHVALGLFHYLGGPGCVAAVQNRVFPRWDT
jgi:hypothetical protein